jgi:hypothetical protein
MAEDKPEGLAAGETRGGLVPPGETDLAAWRRQHGEVLVLDYNGFMPGLVIVCRYPGVVELKAATGEKTTFESTHNFVVKLALWPKPLVLAEVLRARAGLVNAIAGELLAAAGWTAKADVKNG